MDDLTWDDDVFSVDDRFHGLRGIPLPVPIRYKSFPVGAAVAFVTVVLLRHLAIPGVENNVALGVGITLTTTWWLMSKVTYEQSFRALVTIFFHELTGPRRAGPRGESRSLAGVRRLV